MALGISDLLIRVKADVGGAAKDLAAAEGGIGKLGVAAAATGAIVATAAIGIGVASTKMAADFQHGMTTLVTGAGESEQNLGKVSQGILKIAVDTGTSTKQLTDGMFMIESAGFHGAKGLDILKAAAEGARVGNANLGTVADAVTTVMKDYPNVMNGASGATNILIATVARGKTHMEDLAGSLSHVLPAAGAAHVGLNDVMGAMATMTAEGVPAADAATYLRQMIISLEAPSTAGAKALKGIGLTTTDVANAMHKSLPAALELIIDHLKHKFPEGSTQYMEAIKEIAGGSRQMQGFLDLTGIHMQDFVTNTKGIGTSVKDAGNTIQGFSIVQKDLGFQWDRLKEVAETLAIKLGTRLLPIVTQVASWFADNLPKAADFVGKGFERLSKFADGVVQTFASVNRQTSGFQNVLSQAGIVILQVGSWLKDKLGDAITLLAPVVLQAWKAIQQFAGELNDRLGPAAKNVFEFIKTGLLVLQQIWNAAWPVMSVVLKAVWETIKGVVQVAWAVLSGIIKIGLDILGGNWKRAWEDLKGMLKGVWDGILTILQGTWGVILGAIGTWLGNVGATFKRGLDTVGKGIGDSFNNFGTTIHTALQGILSWIAEKWNGLVAIISGPLNAIKGVVQAIWNVIYAIISSIVTIIVDIIRVAWDAIRKLTEVVWGAISGVIAREWRGIQIIISTVWNAISTFIIGAWNKFLDFTRPFWNAVGGAISAAWDAISNVIKQVWNAVSGWITGRWNDFHGTTTNTWNGISGSIGNAWHNMETAIHNVWDRVSSWIGGKWNDFKTFTSNTWNGISNSIVSVWGRIQDGVRGGLNAVVGIMNGGIDAFNSFVRNVVTALSNLDKALGGRGFGVPAGVPHIGAVAASGGGGGGGGSHPGFAKGVKDWKGGLAWIGEEGRELMYVPAGASILPNKQSEMLSSMMGRFPGFANGVGDFFSNVGSFLGKGADWLIQHALDVAGVTSIGVPGLLKPLADVAVDDFRHAIHDTIQSLMDAMAKAATAGPGAGSGTPGNWPGNVTSWILQAMGLRGSPSNWLNGLALIAMHESGGNPNAVNNWDSNAKAGHPSEGLMQMIMPTFVANMLAGHGNIFNPVDNVASAIMYIIRRYGSVFNVPGVVAVSHGRPYVGYDQGGWINEPISGIGPSGTRYQFHANEYVVPGNQLPGKTFHFENHFHASMDDELAKKILREQEWQARLHGGG